MASYQLLSSAESDLEEILEYTLDRHGANQMLKYTDQLVSCFEEISKRKGLYKRLKSRGVEIRSLHCQKHYIFAMEQRDGPVLILAIFHERMNLIERVKDRLDAI